MTQPTGFSDHDSTTGGVPFASLALGEDSAAVRAAIDRVIASGWFILGPEVEAFEAEFALACGAEHAVSVANGTDALALILKALGIGPGDEVITTPVSAAFSALAVLMAGARPVFADVDDRLTLDPAAVAAAVNSRTRAILPVHLYGQPAAMAAIEEIASRHHLALIEDCCQAHLATCDGRPVGTIGVAGAFSFYPTKNLGALGDSGAIVTRDRALADRIRRLRNGGQSERYCHVEAGGVNSRLDELQAAVLRARLPHLPAWTARRRALAALYRSSLSGSAVTPVPERDAGHVYHLFVVRAADRQALQRHLRDRGIETLVHYPTPIPRQPAFASEGVGQFPTADAACDEVLSLPLHHSLAEADVRRVSAAIADFRPRS
jgi:dTDP-3-amino-3,4,6-trideoxy-alpha-D-glucose transaminase